MSDMDLTFSVPGTNEKDNCLPRFYIRAVKNNWRSEREGREIFADEEYVEIFTPGARSTVDRRVKEEDQQRWPQHYGAFKAKQEIPVTGTPIREWCAIGPAQVEELLFSNVRTVEELASLPDATLQKVVPMGGTALRDKAKAFIAQAQGMAPITALQAKNADQEAEIKRLNALTADLAGRLDAMERANPKEAA